MNTKLIFTECRSVLHNVGTIRHGRYAINQTNICIYIYIHIIVKKTDFLAKI